MMFHSIHGQNPLANMMPVYWGNETSIQEYRDFVLKRQKEEASDISTDKSTLSNAMKKEPNPPIKLRRLVKI